ncbi:hypothetical protein FOCC_FOCC011166 [Frankliniella occidentalis]|nr:hypothetical protein FOCC_FOCC011166 [Frankliniella occidentalis]
MKKYLLVFAVTCVIHTSTIFTCLSFGAFTPNLAKVICFFKLPCMMSEEKENHDERNVEEEKAEKLVKLPLSRIKSIIKMDPDVNLASQEAVFLIAKATELFIESLARESYTHTAQSKKKTVQRKDIDAAISSSDSLLFLEGAIDV